MTDDQKSQLIGTFQLNRDEPVHSWYNYLAGYSSEFVKSYVREFGIQKNQLVFEPFAGSGTTLVACKELGIPSFGVEINPFLLFVTRTKLYWDFDIEKLGEKANKLLSSVDSLTLSRDEIEDCPYFIHKAFSRDILEKILKIQKAICLEDNQKERDFFLLGLISILRQVSNYKNWAPYPEPRKKPVVDVNVKVHLHKNIKKMIKDLESIQKQKSSSAMAEVIMHDARHLEKLLNVSFKNRKADFVLTSPPYLNNWDYGWITRIELFFTGFATTQREITSTVRNKLVKSSTYVLQNVDKEIQPLFSNGPARDKIEELQRIIGEKQARRKNPKKYTMVLTAYFNDMYMVLKGLYALMQPSASCCIVIGDSGMYATHVPTDVLLYDLGEQVGFEKKELRILRKRRATRHALDLRESVIVLQR
ncbi:MAG: DNA methyltransferase [Candidatus Odinarchaeota archaeon]